MSIQISSLVPTISKALKEKKFVELTISSEGVTSAVSKVMGAEEFHRQASALCEYTNGILAKKTLRSLSCAEKEEIRDLVDVTYRASEVFSKVYGKQHPNLESDLQYQALSAKLGGKVLPERLKDNESFVCFIKKNHLHHKIQSLGHQVPCFMGLYVEDFTAPIPWKEFKQISTDEEISYVAYGKEWFRTSKNGILTDDYCYLDGKIAKYNPMTSKEFRRYDTEAPTGEYRVEFWSAIIDVNGDIPAIEGDHNMLVLVNNEGHRFASGQFGLRRKIVFSDYFSPLGKKKGGIETPDRYLMLPKDSKSFMKTDIRLTKKQFDTLKNEIENQKVDPNFTVSLLKGNCSSNAVGLLNKVGIKIDNKLHLLDFLFRQIAPRSLLKGVEGLVGMLPKWAQRGGFFFPPIYALTVLAALFTKLFGAAKDVSLLRTVFRPWTLTIDHPFATRQWQKKQLHQ